MQPTDDLTALLAQARAWIADDPDAATRAELDSLVHEVRAARAA